MIIMNDKFRTLLSCFSKTTGSDADWVAITTTIHLVVMVVILIVKIVLKFFLFDFFESFIILMIFLVFHLLIQIRSKFLNMFHKFLS